MHLSPAWGIALGLLSAGLSALVYFWNAAVQAGHRRAMMEALAKQREEDKNALNLPSLTWLKLNEVLPYVFVIGAMGWTGIRLMERRAVQI